MAEQTLQQTVTMLIRQCLLFERQLSILYCCSQISRVDWEHLYNDYTTNNTTRRGHGKNDHLNATIFFRSRSVLPDRLSLAYRSKIRIPGRSSFLGNGIS